MGAHAAAYGHVSEQGRGSAAASEVGNELVALTQSCLVAMRNQRDQATFGVAAIATLVHMRNLCEFLVHKGSEADIRPDDFGSDYRSNDEHLRRTKQRDLYDDLSTHLAHLTWTRLDFDAKAFGFVKMARRFLNAFNEFVDSVPPRNRVLFRSSLHAAAKNLSLAATYDLISGEVTIRSTPALLRPEPAEGLADSVGALREGG